MFNELIVSGKQSGKTNKPWSVAVSAAIQVLVVGGLILIPLIYTEALPKAMLSTFLVAPPPPAPPPPPAAPVKQQVKLAQVLKPQAMVAPTVVPKNIEIVKEEAPAVASNNDAGVLGGTGGVLGGIIGSGPAIAPPPPKEPERISVGGNVEAAKLVNKVQPDYPAIAKSAHVSGTVVLHAIIGKDGAIEKLQFISGPPLLTSAALQAVQQWRYNPTLLNGKPVEVDTTIDVVFSLG